MRTDGLPLMVDVAAKKEHINIEKGYSGAHITRGRKGFLATRLIQCDRYDNRERWGGN